VQHSQRLFVHSPVPTSDEFYRKNILWQKERDVYLIKQKQALTQHRLNLEQESCTFTPQLNPTSLSLVRKSTSSVEDRCMLWAERRKVKMKQLQEQKMKEKKGQTQVQ